MSGLIYETDVFRGTATLRLTVPGERLKHASEDDRAKIKRWLEDVAVKLKIHLVTFIEPPLVTWKH